MANQTRDEMDWIYPMLYLGYSDMNSAILAGIAASSCLSLWGQGQAQGLHDAAQFGPAAGEIAADFSLPDQNGQPRIMESLMARQGLVLVFFRSADW
jgi:hypothetical protein